MNYAVNIFVWLKVVQTNCKQGDKLKTEPKEGMIFMRKFQIPKAPRTTSKSIRMPNEIIEGIEEAITGKDCTFTAFVVEACRVALENLREAK